MIYKEVNVFKAIGLPEIILMIVGSIILGLIIWGVIRLIGLAVKGSNSSKSSTPPLELARQRYAKGEISKDQFEQMKKDLS
jgi:putative membrane protein